MDNTLSSLALAYDGAQFYLAVIRKASDHDPAQDGETLSIYASPDGERWTRFSDTPDLRYPTDNDVRIGAIEGGKIVIAIANPADERIHAFRKEPQSEGWDELPVGPSDDWALAFQADTPHAQEQAIRAAAVGMN